MNKKSKLLITFAIFFALFVIAISLYFQNVFLIVGLIAFIIIDVFLVTRKRLKPGLSVAVVIAELFVLALVFAV